MVSAIILGLVIQVKTTFPYPIHLDNGDILRCKVVISEPYGKYKAYPTQYSHCFADGVEVDCCDHSWLGANVSATTLPKGRNGLRGQITQMVETYEPY